MGKLFPNTCLRSVDVQGASVSPMCDFLNWRYQILPPKNWVRGYYHYPLQDLMQLSLVSTHYIALNFLLPPTKYWDYRSSS